MNNKNTILGILLFVILAVIAGFLAVDQREESVVIQDIIEQEKNDISDEKVDTDKQAIVSNNKKYKFDSPGYNFSVELPTEYSANGKFVSFGPLVEPPESPAGSDPVHKYQLVVIESRNFDEIMEDIQSDVLSSFKSRENLNSLDVVLYEEGGLCIYPTVEVISKRFNYQIQPICGSGRQEEYDYMMDVARSIKLYFNESDEVHFLTPINDYNQDGFEDKLEGCEEGNPGVNVWCSVLFNNGSGNFIQVVEGSGELLVPTATIFTIPDGILFADTVGNYWSYHFENNEATLIESGKIQLYDGDLVDAYNMRYWTEKHWLSPCTDEPVGLSSGLIQYPSSDEYNHLTWLGPIWTAVSCGEERLDEVTGGKDNLYWGVRIDLDQPPSDGLKTVLEDANFTHNEDLTQWGHSNPLIDDLLKIEPYYLEIAYDDCVNCG